jgi:hypothetical protein
MAYTIADLLEHAALLCGDEALTYAGSVGRIASCGHIPLEYYKAPSKSAATFVTYDGVRYPLPRDSAHVEGDGSVTLLGHRSPADKPNYRRTRRVTQTMAPTEGRGQFVAGAATAATSDTGGTR